MAIIVIYEEEKFCFQRGRKSSLMMMIWHWDHFHSTVPAVQFSLLVSYFLLSLQLVKVEYRQLKKVILFGCDHQCNKKLEIIFSYCKYMVHSTSNKFFSIICKCISRYLAIFVHISEDNYCARFIVFPLTRLFLV